MLEVLVFHIMYVVGSWYLSWGGLKSSALYYVMLSITGQILFRCVYIWCDGCVYLYNCWLSCISPGHRVAVFWFSANRKKLKSVVVCTEVQRSVQIGNGSGPIASWAFTHLWAETAHTCRSHTEQFGHWLCQRRGKGSLSQGTRGSGEWCALARNLESGQRAAPLRDAHKQLFAHIST